MWIHLNFDLNQHLLSTINPELDYKNYQKGASNARKT